MTDVAHRIPTAPHWLGEVESPYIQGSFAPTTIESDGLNLRASHGEIPKDLAGMYFRNGPNQERAPIGRYHWFDGDGMIHAIGFENGVATFRNRWVDTAARQSERNAERALWAGLMERPLPDQPFGAGSDGRLKDTSNTDVIFHNGQLISLWYQCGKPYAVDPHTLETKGAETFGGKLPRAVSAHAHVDEHTEELFFFDYSTQAPYMMYHRVGSDGVLNHSVDLGFPGSRLPHDMGLSANYCVFMDMPMFWDAELLAQGIRKVKWHDLPTKWAIIPRNGTAADIKRFETKPMFMHHVANTWEEGDEVIMDGCKVTDGWPFVRDTDTTKLARMMGYLRLDARNYRWRFNLKTGRATEEFLEADHNLEFPMVNMSMQGQKTRYIYNAHLVMEPAQLFTGLCKFDSETGSMENYMLPEGVTLSEAPFAPRVGSTSEDDGYVITFTCDANADTSECWIFAAQDIKGGPIARIPLPNRIPMGFHATWVNAGRLTKRGAQA